MTDALGEAIKGWRFEAVVAALRGLRGIDVVSAIGLVAEIGDINRFDSARRLMGYLGLVPSEHSSAFKALLRAASSAAAASMQPSRSERAASSVKAMYVFPNSEGVPTAYPNTVERLPDQTRRY